MYEVIEHAGMHNQHIVAEFDTFEEAHEYEIEAYTAEERAALIVDITFNGSTEY